MVVFDRQHIVSLLVANGLGDVGLRAHCVNGHDAVFKRERVQQCRNGGFLIGFFGGRCLAHHQPGASGKGADQM